MWNWFTYFLTMAMAVMLVVGGSVCCSAAMAMDMSLAVVSEVADARDESSECGCSHGLPEDGEEPPCGCSCGCDEIGENKRPMDVEVTAAAVLTNNKLDGFELPQLEPRFQALFALWFADFLEPFMVRESEYVARFVDSGPPAFDVPIYLQVQNLRL